MRTCRIKSSRGFAIMEYFIVLIILMTAFYVFKDSFLRGLTGRWKSTGDQMSYGAQFHPTDSVECAFDSVYTNAWYDVTCFENKNCPPGNPGCKSQAIAQCQNDFCNK